MVEETNEDPKVWLLEVNTNPGLRAPTKLIKGGMTRFINSIFDYVLDTEKETFENFITDTWDSDGVHSVFESNQWVQIQHKAGDTKLYRYTANKGDDLYDHNGNPTGYKAKKPFVINEVMYKKKDSYLIPKKMRNMNYDQLKSNLSSMTKNHSNLFHELFTLNNSANQKSEDIVRNSYIIDKMTDNADDNKSWFTKMYESLGGESSQMRDYYARNMGLPFGDSIFRHNFMSGNIDFLNQYLNPELPSIDNKHFGQYLMELQMWQYKQELADKLADKFGNPYTLLFPFGMDPKETDKHKKGIANGMRMFDIGGSMLPEAALITGLGMTPYGSEFYNYNGGLPPLSKKIMNKIKKGRTKSIKGNPLCKNYTKKEMKKILESTYNISGLGELNKSELCEVLMYYIRGGILDIEFPFANQQFLGPQFSQYMRPQVNPIYEFYMQVFNSAPFAMKEGIAEIIVKSVDGQKVLDEK